MNQLPRFDHNSIYKLHRLVSRMDQAADSVLAAFALSYSQYKFLVLLSSSPNSNQADIAASMGVTAAVITRHVAVLSARGYLTQKQDKKNRRRNTIELEKSGEVLLARAEIAVQKQFNKIERILDPTASLIFDISIDKLISEI